MIGCVLAPKRQRVSPPRLGTGSSLCRIAACGTFGADAWVVLALSIATVGGASISRSCHACTLPKH